MSGWHATVGCTPLDRSCRDCETAPNGRCRYCSAHDVLSYCALCGCGYPFPTDLDDKAVCKACRLSPGWQNAAS